MGKRKSGDVSGGKKMKTLQAASPSTQLSSKSSKPAKKSKDEKIALYSSDDSDHEAQENGTTQLFDRASMIKLVTNVQNALPPKDHIKYSTQICRLDWEAIAFDKYTADDCKQTYLTLTGHVRKYRTLTEVSNDIHELIIHNKSPAKIYGDLLPPKPKGPPTSFLIFAAEIREKLLKDNPTLDLVELAKITGEKWRELPDKKRQKYTKMYEQKRIAHKEEMRKYREEHPEFFADPRPKRAEPKDDPHRTKSAVQFYVEDKVKRSDYTDDQAFKDEENKRREKWKKLSEKKRYKYIKKAIDFEKNLRSRMEHELGEKHEKVVNFRSALKKSEKEIYEVMNGKPAKPPMNAYQLFFREKSEENIFASMDAKERSNKLNAIWKGMPDTVKNEFNRRVREIKDKYMDSITEYCKKLSEAEMMEFLVNNHKAIDKKMILNRLLNKEGLTIKKSESSSSSDSDD